MAKQKDAGFQDQDMNSELNTPLMKDDKTFQKKAEEYESGDEILKAKDRNKILDKHHKQQRQKLIDLGVDVDAYEKLGDEEEESLDKKEKEQEDERDEEALEPEEGEDTGITEKEEGGLGDKGEVQGDGDTKLVEKETVKQEPLKLEDVLKQEIPIKINGQEGKVTVAEMQKSYQLQGHLTQQLQQVAQVKAQLESQILQNKQYKEQIDKEHEEWMSQYYTPEEKAAKLREAELKKKEKELAYGTQFNSCKQLLYQIHPDADQLDYSPEFVDFRQKYAPMVSEALLNNYGPGVFFPAMDLVMRYYKDIRYLAGELQKAKDSSTQLTKERTEFLKKREADQREAKIKAKEIKPSTVTVKKNDDDTATQSLENNESYVAKMRKKRIASQGL